MKSLKLRAAARRSDMPASEQRKHMKTGASAVSATQPSRAEAALQYARLGFAVLPLHTARKGVCSCRDGATCSRPGKHPRLKGGVHGATSDPAQIEQLWQKYPSANVGIATGRKSGIIVLDIDPRNGGEETFRSLVDELGPLPATPSSRTGGDGRHYLFKSPDFDVGTDHGKRLGPGIDVQSDGAVIVAPPSRHVSGRRYRWIKNRDLASCKIRSLPPAWLARLSLSSPRAATDQTASSPLVVTPGARNDQLMRVAGKLRNTGLSDQALLQALVAENQRICVPPLDRQEVEKIAASVMRYPASSDSDEDRAEAIMNMVLDQHFAAGEHLVFAPDGQFWSFGGTHWSPLPQQSVNQTVLSVIQTGPRVKGHNTSSLIRQVTSLLSARQAINDDRLGFHSPPRPIINCANGELWIRPDGSVTLNPHTPGSYLRYCLSVPYDPKARSPKFDQALREIFSQSPDTEDLIRHWHEVTGYIIQPQRPIPLVVIGRGSGSNGKTALLQTTSQLLGPELMIAMKIEDLSGNRFAVGSLLGKRLLLDDDVKKGIRLPDGELKKLSEAKMVTGERKFGPTFSFVLQTTPVLLCNDPPSLMDISPGMLRRLMVIPFDRTFSEKEDDRTLFQGIWASELPGILNHAVAGLQRIIRRRWRFELPASVKRASRQWLTTANPLPAFLEECCEQQGNCRVQDLYDAYTDWAKRMGITIAQQQQTFRRNLENLGFAVKRGNRGNRVLGLRLKARTGR